MIPRSTTASPPCVSVVMPTFNGARYLPEALHSLAAQHDPGGLEILAVDDGSDDGTLEELRTAAGALPLRLLEGPRKRNWAASTNCALRAARGAYVGILHQDDRWHRDRLATLIPLATAHPEVAVWVHPVQFIGPDGNRVGRWRCPWPTDRALEPVEWLPRLLVQNVLAVPAVLFRRELFDEVGPMDETSRYTTDWDYWLRMARKHRAWVVPERLADFRVHAESQTFAEARRHPEFVAQLEEVYQRHRPALVELGAPGRYDAMARLGVEVNAWLAARAAGVAWSSRRVLGAARRAGLSGCARYVGASQVLARAMARIRVRRWDARTVRQGRTQ